MSLTPVPQWEQYREEYIDYLRDDEDISTALEYVEQYGDEDIEGDPELRKALEEMGSDLSGFERVFPANDQEVAVVMINPGHHWSKSANGYRDVDNYVISELAADDFENRIQESIKTTVDWLNTNGNDKRNQIISLVNEADLLARDLDKPFQERFFHDVYYANWYKFSTYNERYIPSELRDEDNCPSQFPAQNLRDELVSVDPSTVITFGRFPWLALSDFCEPVKPGGSIEEKITYDSGGVYRFSGSGVEFQVVPFTFLGPERQKSKSAAEYLQ